MSKDEGTPTGYGEAFYNLALGELQALAALIERPPLDDVLLEQDVALRTAKAIKTVLFAEGKFIPNDERAAKLKAALIQYRDDLRYPPTGDSVERRLAMVEDLLASLKGDS